MPRPGDYTGGVRADADEEKSKFYFGNLFSSGRYTPKHRELFEEPVHWEKWLSRDFLLAHGDAARALTHERAEQPGDGILQTDAQLAVGSDKVRKAWAPVLTLECEGGGPGVYSLEIFTQEFCQLLVEEVDYAQANYNEFLTRPNGMNRYGMVLNELGLEPAITELQQKFIVPLQHALFGNEGACPDDHHCFIVRYKEGEDIGLDMHSDSSDVTLNVCLGREFDGATLTFCGCVGNLDHRRRSHVYTHRIGRAVIHLGRQRHGADDIVSGERLGLILWNTSQPWRKTKEYTRLRSRAEAEDPPDLVCLSYTHDSDYREFKAALDDEEARQRGVMLDRVRSNPANRRGGCR
jgi:hypothetical protein